MKRWRTDGKSSRPSLLAAPLALLIVAVAAAWCGGAAAESASPVSTGLSPQRLARVGDFIRDEVAAARIPGAVILIQQHGRPVYFESFGVRDAENRRPMTPDTIFRLYSMSKPITSVAAMMLVEDGKLALGDPVAKYIPAFAAVKVAVEATDENGKPRFALEPLSRPITIEDLMRHTSGITYGFYGDSAVRKLYANSDLFDGDFDNARFVDRLAKLPLAEQPGVRWDYGHSTDVLGRVVEVISGQSLFQFEKQRLLDPLGMSETAFFVADARQRSRIAEPLPGGWFDHPVAGIKDPILPRTWESGGAGMVGTIGDYARFAQMLLNGGTLDGHRYLKPETIALMASDHIGPDTHIARDQWYFPGETSGFGLGFAVRIAVPADTSWPLGEYRWDGVAGTFFFVDPRDDMFAIFMVQAPSESGRIQLALKTLIYQALISR
jgi:CubicO group peptidase (beta-lactamase class C family)